MDPIKSDNEIGVENDAASNQSQSFKRLSLISLVLIVVSAFLQLLYIFMSIPDVNWLQIPLFIFILIPTITLTSVIFHRIKEGSHWTRNFQALHVFNLAFSALSTLLIFITIIFHSIYWRHRLQNGYQVDHNIVIMLAASAISFLSAIGHLGIASYIVHSFKNANKIGTGDDKNSDGKAKIRVLSLLSLLVVTVSAALQLVCLFTEVPSFSNMRGYGGLVLWTFLLTLFSVVLIFLMIPSVALTAITFQRIEKNTFWSGNYMAYLISDLVMAVLAFILFFTLIFLLSASGSLSVSLGYYTHLESLYPVYGLTYVITMAELSHIGIRSAMIDFARKMGK